MTASLCACSPESTVQPALTFAPLGSLETTGDRGFRFGVATAATQIEDQNANTDWHVFTRPEASGGLGKGKAFVGNAASGYRLAVEDVRLLETLRVDAYRFSIEWARVEPVRNQIDEEALQHYDRVIDALIAAGIRPMLTVHHFANPVWIDDPRDLECANGPTDTNLCGLGHPIGGPMVIEEMAQHAALLAARFGDRVDDWATLNEPINYLLAGYGVGTFPPGKSLLLLDLLGAFMPVVRDYLSAHVSMFRAISTADTVDASGDGDAASIGLTLSVAQWLPARDNKLSTNPDDVAARDRLVYITHHLFPQSLLDGTFDADLDGTAEEQQPTWAGTLDWLGVQYYMRAGVTADPGLIPVLKLTPCFGTFDFGACLAPVHATGCAPTMGYESYAPGIYDVLADYGDRWPELPLLVSEAGIATTSGERRAANIVRVLEQISAARDNGYDVRGYYHWSLYDNFEWAEGFDPRFGLFSVDFDTYQRSATTGSDLLAGIANSRGITGAQRTRWGGTGPMLPEPGAETPPLCSP